MVPTVDPKSELGPFKREFLHRDRTHNVQLEPDFLDLALDHIEHRGDTDIFLTPFEFQAIRHSWASIRDSIIAIDPLRWEPGRFRQTLVPKGYFGFRVATQLDPLDSIFLTALTLQCAEQIEAARLPIADQIVHSNRFALGPRGQIFDPQYGYGSFRLQSLKLASSGQFSHVVMTDIGDFFARIYHHPLENSIAEATDEQTARIFGNFFSSLSSKRSIGIPIGPAVCRLLANLAINDVDNALLSEGIKFCRYSDDFTIFTNSAKKANEALTFLATTLFQNHGLTLQASKTETIDVEEYVKRYSHSEESRARDRVAQLINESVLFQSSMYQVLELDDLDPERQEELRLANLWELLRESLYESPADLSTARFALQWLRLEGDADGVDFVFENLDKLYPIFRTVMAYFVSLPVPDADQPKFASRILDLLEHERIGVLEYHRGLILDPFADRPLWDHKDRLFALYRDHRDVATRRAVILGLAAQNQTSWFRTNRGEATDMKQWEKRAFLWGARLLPRDERNTWYRAINSHLNELDRSIVKYVKDTH
jgi:hypothetical protein